LAVGGIESQVKRKKATRKTASSKIHQTATPIAQTIAQAAGWYGVGERTFMRWRGRPGFPARKAKGYDLRAVDQWLAQRFSRSASGLTEIKAELLRLDLREREGELIDALEVQRVILSATSTARAILAELPDRLIKMLDLEGTAAETTRQVARSAVHNALESLASIPVELQVAEDGDDSARGEDG